MFYTLKVLIVNLKLYTFILYNFDNILQKMINLLKLVTYISELTIEKYF